jgi:hypothetical protein
MRTYRAPDGVEWKVQVTLPGSSNIMVIFRHPDGDSSHSDRYNWWISKGPEARSVTARLSPERVIDQIDDGSLARLFGRSMPVSREASDPSLALGLGGSATGLSRGIGRVVSTPEGGVDGANGDGSDDAQRRLTYD